MRANRLGHEHYSATELKIIAEVLSLVIFLIFSMTYLREPGSSAIRIKWNY